MSKRNFLCGCLRKMISKILTLFFLISEKFETRIKGKKTLEFFFLERKVFTLNGVNFSKNENHFLSRKFSVF